MPNEQRDRDIIALREVGVPGRDIARRFGLSEDQVRRIELRSKTLPPTPDNISLLRDSIRAADDPLKLWPAVDLVHALDLLPATQRALLTYLDRTETNELSLFDLMDLVLLDKGQRVVNTQNSPLFVMPGIGKKGYLSAAKALTALNMGTKANALWSKRIASLQGQWRISQ